MIWLLEQNKQRSEPFTIPLASLDLPIDATVLRTLISYDADINQKDNAGNTLLWNAIKNNNTSPASYYGVSEVAQLLDFKADPMIINSEGVSPLGYATQIAYKKLAKLLIHHNARNTVQDIEQLFGRAIEHPWYSGDRWKNTVKWLKKSWFLEEKTCLGFFNKDLVSTFCQHAIHYNDRLTVFTLLDRGMRVDVKTKKEIKKFLSNSNLSKQDKKKWKHLLNY